MKHCIDIKALERDSRWLQFHSWVDYAMATLGLAGLWLVVGVIILLFASA